VSTTSRNPRRPGAVSEQPGGALLGEPASPTTKRIVGIALGVILVLAFAAFATGFDDPEVPEGAVAVVEEVDEGEISMDDFEVSLEQVAASQGVRGGPPKPGDEQYEAFKEQAMSDLVLQKWVEGEAADRGITASDREVEQQLEQIKQQNFGSEKEYQRFLEESGFTEEEALERVRLSVLSQKIQEELVQGSEDVAQEDIEVLYEQQKAQFEQPESRDVRVIVNKDESKVEQAREELEQDDSEESWKRVAEKYSTDEATSGSGGLRENVIEGEGDPAFDEAVFGASEGELVGPFETGDGNFNLIQVVKVTPAETQPLDEASKQIEQQLASAQQQAALDAFEQDLTAKWSDRTFCAEDFVVDSCSNFEQPAADSCSFDDPSEIEAAAEQEQPQDESCPAPVQSRNPASPVELSETEAEERTQAQLQPLQQPYSLVPGGFPQGLPQGPLPPPAPEGALPGGLPAGSLPIGPGTVPPTGGAPPTGAPPTGGAPAAPTAP
jgi:parvulin-like peptidyl-prolyl isomerase